MVEASLLAQTLKFTHGHDFEFAHAEHNQAFHNLNLMVQHALSLPRAAWQRFTIIEQDHAYPRDLLARLERLEPPIVGAPYWKRTERDLGVMVPGWWREGRLVPLTRKEYALMTATSGCHPIDVVGTCLLSIDRQVLQDWPRQEPWFRPQYEGRKLIGYETWFCLKAKELGYQVMLDTRLEIDHYARLPVRDARLEEK